MYLILIGYLLMSNLLTNNIHSFKDRQTVSVNCIVALLIKKISSLKIVKATPLWPPTHPQLPRPHLYPLYKFWGYILLYLHPRTEAWLWVLSHKVPVEQWRSENNLRFIKKNRKEKRGDLVLNEVLCLNVPKKFYYILECFCLYKRLC